MLDERLDTAEQTASSSSRVLQHTTIGRHGRRPAMPKRSTRVSCLFFFPILKILIVKL